MKLANVLVKILWRNSSSHSFAHFQKRKAEDEPLEKEEEDKASDDAPKEDAEETNKDEAVQSVTAEPEEEKKEVPQIVTQPKRPKAANPYGTWEKIQEEEDP